jgi:hypothetical protein
MIHPNLPNIEISRMLGVHWKCLDESALRPYKERARAMQVDFKREHPDYKYDKARQKRQAHELLVQQNKQPINALELAGLDPAVYLQFLQTIAMGQGKQNVTQVLPAAPPDTHVGLSADFQFPPDLFDPRSSLSTRPFPPFQFQIFFSEQLRIDYLMQIQNRCKVGRLYITLLIWGSL